MKRKPDWTDCSRLPTADGGGCGDRCAHSGRSRKSLRVLSGRFKSRAGMTLVELLLVIAIIVVVAALSVPSIQRTLKSQGIKSGAKRVSVAMGQARVKSIRSGEVHALFYAPNGSWFDVAPLSDYQEIVSRRSSREESMKQTSNRDLESDLLPKDVTFSSGQTASDSRSAASEADMGGGLSGVQMILFYPDGTSQDAQVTVRNSMGDQWRIELRGLTGMSTTMRVDTQANGR